MSRLPLALLFLLAAAAPATARTLSLHCDQALHVWCENGACAATEVTPFVLILDGANSQIETCQGEHCESGVFEVAPELGRNASDTLLFGSATLEAHPLPASFAGVGYGLTVDTAAKAVSLSRITPGSISVLQVSGCGDWTP